MPILLNEVDAALLHAKPVDFVEVFNALFIRGGFAAYTAEYAERDCERFVDDFETPDNYLTIQAICACRLMQLLPHPGFGVLLLIDAHMSEVGFQSTWSLASRCCARVFTDWRVLILVMRIFCDKTSDETVWEGFSVSDLFVKRTKKGWVQFAKDRYSDRWFLAKWWVSCEISKQSVNGVMREAISASAETELTSLPILLLNRERAALLDRKTKALEKERVKAELSAPAEKKRKYTPRAVAVTKKDEAELIEVVAKEEENHRHVITKLGHVLSVKKMSKIGAKMAGIVGALTRMYPLIAWNLKETVHNAAAGRSTFATEQKLFAHRLDLAPTAGVLTGLEQMV
jgi:hypothetical protein